jgi:hypothetical protein
VKVTQIIIDLSKGHFCPLKWSPAVFDMNFLPREPRLLYQVHNLQRILVLSFCGERQKGWSVVVKNKGVSGLVRGMLGLCRSLLTFPEGLLQRAIHQTLVFFCGFYSDRSSFHLGVIQSFRCGQEKKRGWVCPRGGRRGKKGVHRIYPPCNPDIQIPEFVNYFFNFQKNQ